MFDSVGETCPVPMGCGFEGEEHIKLVRTPVLHINHAIGILTCVDLAKGRSSQSKLDWWKTIASNISTLARPEMVEMMELDENEWQQKIR